MTLWYLAKREPQQSVSLSYCICKATISKIASKSILAIYSPFKDPFMKVPPSQEEWFSILASIEQNWNSSYCIASINGKNIQIEFPKIIGTYYCCYKDIYSIVLLAICDSNYCFTLFSITPYGNKNDSGVLVNLKFKKMKKVNWIFCILQLTNSVALTLCPIFMLEMKSFYHVQT